ncbi:hypothetical protein diail_7881 [Diaporthe ilicicola]|nr:hypothetical protein diail_7881 [Diaporthe ilicicola]
MAVQSRAGRKVAEPQEPFDGEGLPPTTDQVSVQIRSDKRGIIDDEDECSRPIKRQKIQNIVGDGMSTEKPIRFRPANRAPPTEEDLELTQSDQGDTQDAEDEENIESDPPSPQVSTTKRVSELRGGDRKRSSRRRHLEKVARRNEHGHRSGLNKEWSMS